VSKIALNFLSDEQLGEMKEAFKIIDKVVYII